MQDRHETGVDSKKGLSQDERFVSNIHKRSRQRDRQRELENLHKKVNDLEIELRGRRCKKDREGSSDDLDYEVE